MPHPPRLSAVTSPSLRYGPTHPGPLAARAGKYAEKVMKSTAELETVVTIIAANERQMRRHDPLRKYMDIIVDHVEKVCLWLANQATDWRLPKQ